MIHCFVLPCPDDIIWPDGEDALPADAQDLITRLLKQSPLERLGTGWWQRPRHWLDLSGKKNVLGLRLTRRAELSSSTKILTRSKENFN